MSEPTVLIIVVCLATLMVAFAAVAAMVFVRSKNRIDELERTANRFRGVVDAEAEAERIRSAAEMEAARTRSALEMEAAQRRNAIQVLSEQLGQKQNEMRMVDAELERLRGEIHLLDGELELHAVGFYRPRFDYGTSTEYREAIERCRAAQKDLIRAKRAAIGKVDWYVNNSRTEGRKQINQTLKLMLRAFNGECDAAIASVKYNNFPTMEARIRKSRDAVNQSAEVQGCEITRDYLELKLRELRFAYEYQEKLQAEREEQRAIREQMREEEIARRELERAEQDAARDELRYADALARARSEVERVVGAKQQKMLEQISLLEQRLAEAQAARERAIARAQLTRSGHVYVISNIGSFGENIYKIGMTRRLDPMDRVRELGDASVPFTFDVHAIIWTEDAPGLETALHRAFDGRRVNQVNLRKEFFAVTLDEIARVVRANHGEIEFTLVAEAKEYRQSIGSRAALGAAPIAPYSPA